MALTNILTMSRVTDYLEAHQSSTPTRWREDAQWRRDNDYWLKYSRIITLRVLQAMDQQSVTQVELARRMSCTQQYISNLLKGTSNMTLETIARLERALNLDLIKSALSSVTSYDYSSSVKRTYLNDSGGKDFDPSIRTSELVDGYESRKE